MTHSTHSLRLATTVLAAVSLLTLGVYCAAASASASSPGYTATFAEGANASPEIIYPLATGAGYTTTNIEQFEYLMYRPLYWFGNGDQATVNPMLSLANLPVFSNGNTTVTLTMKGWHWSDGETVTAQDVVFWMNLIRSGPSGNLFLEPGFPDDVVSVTTPTPMTVQFTLNAPVNKTWFLYNVLSLITPFPMAWNVLGPQTSGAQDCGTATYADVVSDVGGARDNCYDLQIYLDEASGWNPITQIFTDDTSTFVGSPLWSVVDGPWQLSYLDATGKTSFTPNPSYDGPVTGNISTFTELPFSSDAAELAALQNTPPNDTTGAGVTVGWLPLEDAPCCAPAPNQPGPNASGLSNYDMYVSASSAINYMPFNFQSTDNGGNTMRLFAQPYIRQVLQMLVNQPQLIKDYYNGYGLATYSPLPPGENDVFATEYKQAPTYPDDPTTAIPAATALLIDHGWTLVGGVWTCTVAGSDCDQNSLLGVQLSLNVRYDNVNEIAPDAVLASEVGAWNSFGINVTTTGMTFNQVLDGSSNAWDLKDWGGGWLYTPDNYPSGEYLYLSGSTPSIPNGGFNIGAYANTTMDSLINQTETTDANLGAFANFASQDLPVLWQPTATSVSEVQSNLIGASPISTLENLNPEFWSFATPPAISSISGTTRDTTSGDPLSGICVTAYSAGASGFNALPGTVTAADGTYTIPNLPAGSYDLQFSTGCGNSNDYVTQWYNNAAGPATSTSVSTGATANASLVLAGAISGTVTDTSGVTDIENVCVNAYVGDSTTPSGITGITASDGSYTISGLAPDSYTVSADPTCGGATPSNYSYETDQSRVAVTSGMTTSSVDLFLASGADAAPAPATTDGITFGTPTTALTSSEDPTSIIQSELGSSAGILVPAGALPTDTSVSVFPVLDPGAAAAALTTTSTTAYVAAYGVSWQTTDDSSPTATSPITMTLTDPNIAVGDEVYVLTADGPQLVGTATVAGTITFTFTQDPVFVVGAPPSFPQVSQFISFGPLSNEVLGTTPFSVSAAATSGLAVTYASGTPSVCTVSGASVTAVAVGTCRVIASQPGNAYWLPAPEVSQSFVVQYGFGGFISPLNKSNMLKSGSNIPVKFVLTSATGTRLPAVVEANLAASGAVDAVLNGYGINSVTAVCAWSVSYFQCNLKTPSGLKTGGTPYTITAKENVGAGFITAPPIQSAINPETVYFK